ncbi:MAG: ADP-ribosylglycohydrolase family protein [Oligosphaeraceae bacterium]
MIGALIGDIVGSRFEWDNCRSKEFPLLPPACFFTDDSIMSLAVAKALLDCRPDASDLEEHTIRQMQTLGREYPDGGYGGMFSRWLRSPHPQPYGSYGNGAAMRVSACGYAGETLEQTRRLSRIVTAVTHDHPEGIKGAEATAVGVWMARTGSSMAELRAYLTTRYYPIDFTLDEIRETYSFNETCQETVPQALEAFFESTSFEDAIRNAISIGGDSDTLAAITGAVAEAYYGVPEALRRQALSFLDPRLEEILLDFEAKHPPRAPREIQG